MLCLSILSLPKVTRSVTSTDLQVALNYNLFFRIDAENLCYTKVQEVKSKVYKQNNLN